MNKLELFVGKNYHEVISKANKTLKEQYLKWKVMSTTITVENGFFYLALTLEKEEIH